MAPRSRRLAPLLAHADAKRNEAAQQFAEKTKAVAMQQQRLQDLHRYANEYAPAPGLVDPAQLANRLAFRARIEQAVGQQQKVLETSKAHAELERARLLLTSRDQRVLEQLADSYRVREAKQDNQRVQKELDDLAGRAARMAKETPR